MTTFQKTNQIWGIWSKSLTFLIKLLNVKVLNTILTSTKPCVQNSDVYVLWLRYFKGISNHDHVFDMLWGGQFVGAMQQSFDTECTYIYSKHLQSQGSSLSAQSAVFLISKKFWFLSQCWDNSAVIARSNSFHITQFEGECPLQTTAKRRIPDTISVLFINWTGSRWERIGRLKEEAMAFNFLKGVRPATALQLLFIRWPVIPSGLGLVSSYRLSFKHTASLPQQRNCAHTVYLHYLYQYDCSQLQIHINVKAQPFAMTI